MAEQATALLALWNDVDPALDAAYNEWHAHEHVPERCTVPGILWGRRYGRVAGATMPRYLTLYGLRDPKVLDSEAYRRLLREPTPMSRTMRPALRHISRWVCRLHESVGNGEGSHLAVWALPQRAAAAGAPSAGLQDAPGVGGHLLAERIRDAAPLPWLATGQDRGIEGQWLLCGECDELTGDALTSRDATLYARLAVG
jgi:hypothetical protein